MALTKFPNGIQATPFVGGCSDFAGWFGTNVWYVDGDNGSDSQSIGDMDSPFATIQKAIDSASAGDTIYVRALGYGSDASDPDQYAEDLEIPYALNDLKIIGVNSSGTKLPYAGPKIKNSTATTLLSVLAPGVHLENLQFNCTRSSGTYGIWCQADTSGYTTKAGSVGFTMVNCFIKNGSVTYYGLKIDGGYGSVISNCTFQGCLKGINLQGDPTPHSGHTIENCNFKAINNATITVHIAVSAGSSHDWTITNCNFQKATKLITCGAGAGVSGVISFCGFSDGVTAVDAASTGKIEIPSTTDNVGVCGCWDGAGAIISTGGS